MAATLSLLKTFKLVRHLKPFSVNVIRCASQYYPIDDNLYGISDEQKQVGSFILYLKKEKKYILSIKGRVIGRM